MLKMKDIEAEFTDEQNLVRKQEYILDKIRDEIEQTFLDDGAMQEYTVNECLRIIGKYKAESENE